MPLFPYRKKFIFLDLETTDLDPQIGRIMEVGAVKVELSIDAGGKKAKIEFGKEFATLVNPEIEPSSESLALTGIRAEDLKTAPLWREVRPALQKFLKNFVLVGHNFGFDLSFLEAQGLRLKNEILDSLELVQVFFPDLPSYSLEFLVQELELPSQGSHRALFDCKSTAWAVAAVINRFLCLDEKTQEKMQKLLQKSALGFRAYFLDLPAVFRADHEKKQGQAVQGEFFVDKTTGLLSIPEFKDKTIYHWPLGFREEQSLLEEVARRRSAFVACPAGLLEGIPKKHRVYSPEGSICSIRRVWAENLDNLGDFLAKILIKLAILDFLGRGANFYQGRFLAGEKMILPGLMVESQICQKHECDFVRLFKFEPGRSYFTDFRTLFALVRDWQKFLPKKMSLLFVDLPRLEDEFYRAEEKVWNLRRVRQAFLSLYALEPGWPSRILLPSREVQTFASELDLFFGILHLVYRQAPGQFSGNVLLDKHETESERFEKLVPAAEKFLEKLKIFLNYLSNQQKIISGEDRLELTLLRQTLQEFSDFLKEFFFSRTAKQIYWLKFNDQWVDLGIAPKQILKQWKNFVARFSAVSILDLKLPQISREYYERRLGITDYEYEDLTRLAPKISARIKIFARAQSHAEQWDLLAGLRGRVVAVVPSEAKLRELYHEYLARGEFSKTVLTYKFTGNGQILMQRFHDCENAILFVTTKAMLRQFTNLPRVENLVIWKLPFEAPGARPAVATLASGNSFMDEVMPRAINILHSLFSKFFRIAAPNCQVLLFDSRIMRDYEQGFYKYLQEVFPSDSLEVVD